jgi:hypothetical protein
VRTRVFVAVSGLMFAVVVTAAIVARTGGKGAPPPPTVTNHPSPASVIPSLIPPSGLGAIFAISGDGRIRIEGDLRGATLRPWDAGTDCRWSVSMQGTGEEVAARGAPRLVALPRSGTLTTRHCGTWYVMK